jgi:hypothetical protein
MALSQFQRELCRLLAEQRIVSGESYVAGGVALNEVLGAQRLSNDVDLFHDSEAALTASWNADRELLRARGYSVETIRERPSFVEASIRQDDQHTILQWSRDSAFRFFPLVRHPDFGLTLHPFDLATNKVLALVGRLEVRDWIDVIECGERVQGLGYLAWAACGKDPGFSPTSILEQAGRSTRYSAEEVSELAFDGPTPDAGDLSQRWHTLLSQGREIVSLLPGAEVGRCVLGPEDELCRLSSDDLPAAIQQRAIRFHRGSLRGAFPVIRNE